MKLYVNLFCQDIVAQMQFYATLLGLPEARHSRSPIFRAIETAGFQFGFHAPPAYALLSLTDRKPRVATPADVSAYPTFMLESPDAVNQGCARAAELGGRVIKRPYATYYGEWQAVLDDPEGHVFRLSTPCLPIGVEASTLQLPES